MNEQHTTLTGLTLAAVVVGVLAAFALLAIATPAPAPAPAPLNCDEILKYEDGTAVCEIFLKESGNHNKPTTADRI